GCDGAGPEVTTRNGAGVASETGVVQAPVTTAAKRQVIRARQPAIARKRHSSAAMNPSCNGPNRVPFVTAPLRSSQLSIATLREGTPAIAAVDSSARLFPMPRTLMHVAIAVVVLSFTPLTASAQRESATLVGTVRDASGLVMPGVTVEVTSPVLIERSKSTQT